MVLATKIVSKIQKNGKPDICHERKNILFEVGEWYISKTLEFE